MPATVFLSYARGDDEEFVARLHADLTARGFDVWFDRVSMPSRTLTFHQEIKDAIRTRDRVVLVLGPKAATSDYVMEEWRFAWNSEKPIVPILRLGDYTLVPDLLKFYHCESFKADDRHEYEFHLAQLVRILSEPEPPLGKLVAVPTLPPHFLEQPDRLLALKDLVLTDLQKPVVITGAASRVGLHGMGGIGKSVLACVLAHDRQVRQSFPDGVIWLPHSQQPNLVQLQRNAAVALGGEGLFDNQHQGKTQLRKLCLNKAALFVLDDVWDARHANAFDVLGPRCRALVTTRDAGLLHSLRATEYRVELLSDTDAVALLAKSCGNDPAELPAKARQVARECDHLPLALALCGGMAFGQHAIGWGAILSALRSAELEEIATDHPLAENHASLWRAITLSVQYLTPEEQRRFAELAVFPEDEAVPEAVVYTLWRHAGGLKPLALEKLLKRFAERALIVLDTDLNTPGKPLRRVSMHDLLRDYAKRIAGDTAELHARLIEAYRALCPDGWPSGPDDGWFLQHLGDHLCETGRGEEFASLLLEFPWLERKAAAGLTFDLPGDFQAAQRVLPVDHPDALVLPLIEEALRRDIHFIRRHANDYPPGLFQCLWNSCWWYDCSEAASHYGKVSTSVNCPFAQTHQSAPGTLMTQWKQQISSKGNRRFLRLLRPPAARLGSGFKAEFQGHQGEIYSITWTKDGREIVSCGSDDKTIRVWDAATGAERLVLNGHTDRVEQVACSCDGLHIASCSWDGTVRIWELTTGKQLKCFVPERGERVSNVAWLSDGKNIATWGGSVDIWNLDSDALLESFDTLGHVALAINHLDGEWRLLTKVGGNDYVHDIFLLDAKKSFHLWDSSDHSDFVSCAAWSHDSKRIATASWDKSVIIWDAKSGRKLLTLTGHKEEISHLEWSPNNDRIATASWDESVRVWDSQKGQQVCTFIGHRDRVECVAWSPDGRWLASSARDKTIRIWDTSTPRNLVLQGHNDHICAIAFSSDGRWIATGSVDRSLRLWDCETGLEISCLNGHAKAITHVAWSPNGEFVASTSLDDTFIVWSVANRSARCISNHPHCPQGERNFFCEPCITTAAWSPDSSKIATVSNDYLICIWELPCQIDNSQYKRTWHPMLRPRLLLKLDGRHDVWSIAWSPDGSRLASSSVDKTILIWDTKSGTLVLKLEGNTKWLTRVMWSREGDRIVSKTDDGIVRIWNANTGDRTVVMTGVYDVEAIAIGRAAKPWHVSTAEMETVVSDRLQTPIAYYPRPLTLVTAHPNKPIWAGADGSHLTIFQLEDFPSKTEGIGKTSETRLSLGNIHPDEVQSRGHRRPRGRG